jgi:hypothetical protein
MAGQSVGLVHDIAPAADVLRRVLADADVALGAAGVALPTRRSRHGGSAREQAQNSERRA